MCVCDITYKLQVRLGVTCDLLGYIWSKCTTRRPVGFWQHHELESIECILVTSCIFNCVLSPYTLTARKTQFTNINVKKKKHDNHNTFLTSFIRNTLKKLLYRIFVFIPKKVTDVCHIGVLVHWCSTLLLIFFQIFYYLRVVSCKQLDLDTKNS